VDILGNQIVGPIVLPNRLTGAVYHRFLVIYLPVLLEQVPLHQWQHMQLMHDGSPPHFRHIVRQHLNQTFSEQWIGCRGPFNLPAQSPDHNSLDFWLWGHLNILVYSALIDYLEVSHQWVENTCQEIQVKPGIFNRVCTSVRRRAESCVEMHGNHIEYGVEITWIWPISLQAYPIKAYNPFSLTPCIWESIVMVKKQISLRILMALHTFSPQITKCSFWYAVHLSVCIYLCPTSA
jgi:hypothetical protein